MTANPWSPEADPRIFSSLVFILQMFDTHAANIWMME